MTDASKKNNTPQQTIITQEFLEDQLQNLETVEGLTLQLRKEVAIKNLAFSFIIQKGQMPEFSMWAKTQV